jgi:deoxyribodipyrimidine photo-lyase
LILFLARLQQKKHLENFIANRLNTYATNRNLPNLDGQSGLSPYLHFGNVSSLRIVLELMKYCDEDPLLFRMAKLASFDGEPTIMDSINALFEELIVRKELADNYCFYNNDYDNFNGAKSWAKESLDSHKNDDRHFLYQLSELENAETHDAAWNSAQRQMMVSGKMHGYMRMYWAKKILEWSNSADEAIKNAVYLNDKYSIDGGDPNGYTGIMWSIAGVHDRPWFDRQIFGKIRYMNYEGLKRKFEIESYIKTWSK